MSEKLTNEQKHKWLVLRGWQTLLGHVLHFSEKEDDIVNIVISRKQVEKFYNEKPIMYYWCQSCDYYITLDDAFELELECFADDLDVDIDMILTEEILKQLQGKQ